MNTMEIVGIQPVNYTSRKTGRPVVGTNLFVQYEDSKINGYGTDRLYVSDAIRNGQIFSLGDEISVSYNRYGSIESVIVQ